MDALRHNSALRTLVLRSCWLGTAEVSEIICSLQVNRTVTRVDISFSLASEEAFVHLGDLLTINQTLELLILRYNEVRVAIIPMAKSLEQNRSLRYLDLSHTGIGLPEVRALSQMLLVNTTLQSLVLQSNHLREDSLREIHTAMRIKSTIHRPPMLLSPCEISHIRAA